MRHINFCTITPTQRRNCCLHIPLIDVYLIGLAKVMGGISSGIIPTAQVMPPTITKMQLKSIKLILLVICRHENGRTVFLFAKSCQYSYVGNDTTPHCYCEIDE